ncbi:bidirectional sugar transporter SWEET9-like [Gastrolobium bilobum]|uniref:bidirectional sugar transporter SWEET9-like n=1 Tax=Gastrolobium bilobum TaxID=150636 RepID=UPI002AB2AD80|nr:bidirectional sugar transporter SWEET9-like [Gastrolobium bilobum]
MALFNSMLILYYAHLKGHGAFLLVTIGSFGCAIQAAYLITFFTFSNSRTRLATAQLIIVFNGGVYIGLVCITSMLTPSPHKLKVAGWICATSSVCTSAAPLSIMRTVIKTKSVRFMPFPLSLCLTQSAIVWFLYGMFSHDYFIAMPSILGFLLGVAQIILYLLYKKGPRREKEPSEIQNVNETLAHDDACEVEGEMVEFGDNMKHPIDNTDEDEAATTLEREPPKMDGEEIVEIPE